MGIKFKQSLVLLLMFVFLGGTHLFAQEGEPVQNNQKQEMDVSQEGNVSLDFRDADIQNVLRILAYKSGVNIVASPTVTGLVTIKLKDVPWKQALEVILRTYGYAYEERGSVIMVTTVEDLKKRREDSVILAEQEPLVTETFLLNYAKAADIIESLNKMKTARGSINFDERTNAIIVTDISENIVLIAKVVKQLDATTPQVLIEAKIIETRLNNSENLGIDWTTKVTVGGAAAPTTWPFTSASGSKYLPDDFPGADSDTDFTYGTLNFAQLQAVLELLSTRTDTNILSNPKIVTLDNKPARIEVGVEHPIPTFGVNPETAQLQATSIEYRNIGINFQVTPHVNNAGFVTLEIMPEVSETAGSVSFQGINVPLISTEKASTNVMVRDGETLVIAGLIKDTVVDVKKKTPLLGDIPLLGLAFQKTEKTVSKTDLLIFLTPHIITQELAEADAEQEKEK